MADISVIVKYKNELESISIDGFDMEDVSSIRNKPIRDWFSASNGRDGWEGLIEEIQKIVDDEKANFKFEFEGPEESKYIFEQCTDELGYGNKEDGLSKDEIVQKYMDEAWKAEQKKRPDQAIKWYRKAAKKGNISAMYNLGRCYDKGIGVEEDFQQAFEWYRKAAEKGNISAMYN